MLASKEGTIDPLILPDNYENKLGLRETQIAIKLLKDYFENRLAEELSLVRVSAPLFVRDDSGLNDTLNGIERPVSFDVKGINGEKVEIVHSLAKWKRFALKKYRFDYGDGLYTDMNAIRRDEDLDNIHSIYVDQWDWEKIIHKDERNMNKLEEIVRSIFKVFKRAEQFISDRFPQLHLYLPENISFITTQELEDMYPELTPPEREDAIAKEKKAVFIMKIGGLLKSGIRHDNRAPDYDDWELNGDILFWYPVLNRSVEVSSMGIRVDEQALINQLALLGCEDRKELFFHKALLNGELPYTVGGGIGQSRLCMFFLNKAHIGEVQASVWPDNMIKVCSKANIELL